MNPGELDEGNGIARVMMVVVKDAMELNKELQTIFVEELSENPSTQNGIANLVNYFLEVFVQKDELKTSKKVSLTEQ
jgi:hypothetical protein